MVLYHDHLLFTDDKLEPFILRLSPPRRTEAVLLEPSDLGKSAHSSCLLRPFRSHLSPLCLEGLSGSSAYKTGLIDERVCYKQLTAWQAADRTRADTREPSAETRFSTFYGVFSSLHSYESGNVFE